MRLTLLVAVFLLSLDTCLAATPVVAAPGTASYPKPHLRFKERKGTMGFVYGALLGPVGYAGVIVFSRHNEMMRYQAGRGFRIWALVVASGVILMGCAALKADGDTSAGLLSSMWASF